MPSSIQFPYPGMQSRVDEKGKLVLRLHYSADPEKAAGEPVWNERQKMWLSVWADAEERGMSDPNLFKQEYEIDGSATLGAMVFPQFDAAVTLEDSFPIPPFWTRITSLDPHPAVPHAWLWGAVDPWGDRWYYRELWPSKVCFRYDGVGGPLMGKSGKCPEDDNRYNIRQYCQFIEWLESADNPENVEARSWDDPYKRPFAEKVHKRVIDYAARSFGKGTNDDPEQENFQQRYQQQMALVGVRTPYFEDAKKDRSVGIELVNEGLRPLDVMGRDGEYHRSSRIHIFRDRCPELIYQIQNNRFEQLSPTQADRMDPTGRPVAVRAHMTDNLRYVEMSNPLFIDPAPSAGDYHPSTPGLSY